MTWMTWMWNVNCLWSLHFLRHQSIATRDVLREWSGSHCGCRHRQVRHALSAYAKMIACKCGNMEGEPGAWEPSTTSSTNKKSFRILIRICTQRCQPLVSLACPRSKHVPLLQDLFREIGPTAASFHVETSNLYWASVFKKLSCHKEKHLSTDQI